MNLTKRMLYVMSMLVLFVGLAFTQTGNDYTSPTIGALKHVPAGTFDITITATTSSFTQTAFIMSEKEITRTQYTNVTGIWVYNDMTHSVGSDYPVQNVNWYHALVFCNMLSMLEGLTPVYTINGSTDPAQWGSVPLMQENFFLPTKNTASWDAVTANWNANGYRLPTEMEWMWAAMGADKENPGKVNITGYKKKFAGDNGRNNIGDYAWNSNNSNATTHPVGTKKPNELGLYDMSGNVSEWCWDWGSKDGPTGSNTDYRGAAPGVYRVYRYGKGIANRGFIYPHFQDNNFGFRVVRSIEVAFTQTANDYISPTIGKLKYVPAGTFSIQIIHEATTDTAAYTEVIGTATISAFRMSEKEITREQFEKVMGYDPSNTKYSSSKQDPVQMVKWYHTVVFCNKLSILEGLTPVYSINGSTNPEVWGTVPTDDSVIWNAVIANWSANGYRLPTEMEWMWAAMGAVNGTTGYTKAFAGSNGTNAIGDYAWTRENSRGTTHPVGTKQPNELGLYDMSGNVWEWCWDRHRAYPAGSTSNYRGAASGAYRVFRGGSWSSNASYAAVAHRSYIYPYVQGANYGFRVVRNK